MLDHSHNLSIVTKPSTFSAKIKQQAHHVNSKSSKDIGIEEVKFSNKLLPDAKEYYAQSHQSPRKSKMLKSQDSLLMSEELKAECYIGFSKFLKQEMKTFDMKDSMVYDLRINSLQKKKLSHTTTPYMGRKSSSAGENQMNKAGS